MYSYCCLFGDEQKRLVVPLLQIDFIAKVVLLQNLSYISLVCSLRLEPFFWRTQQQGGELHQGEDNNLMTIKDKIVIEFGGSPWTFCKRILLKNDKTPKRGKKMSYSMLAWLLFCVFSSQIKSYYNKGKKTVSRDSQLQSLNIDR